MAEHNRREVTRIPLCLDAILRSHSTSVVSGKTTDVSLKGIHVACDNSLPVGPVCQLTLLFGPQTDPLHIELEGTVVRADKSGMAVEIADVLPINTLTLLQNIVRYNAADASCIDQELHERVSRRWGHAASDNSPSDQQSEN